MREAKLWTAHPEDMAHCHLCCHFCRIPAGQRGQCGVRVNQAGKLYTEAYDQVAAANIDPVEKKPLYHFLPGTQTFSFGTMGCNLGCSFCQNYTLSQPPREGRPVAGHPATPGGLVKSALDSGCSSISYTYSEPTIFFELMYDTAGLAQDQGLKNIMVSNGFMSPQCLDELAPLIDAANIDLKADTEAFYADVCQAKLAPVKKNLRRMRELGWWLEVTTLIIPGLNDSAAELTAMAKFLADELGPETPWHLSRFHPDYKLQDRPPTPVATLQMAQNIGRQAGLKFVYVGNVPGGEHNATACPKCGRTVIERTGFAVRRMDVDHGLCPACREPIPGRF